MLVKPIAHVTQSMVCNRLIAAKDCPARTELHVKRGTLAIFVKQITPPRNGTDRRWRYVSRASSGKGVFCGWYSSVRPVHLGGLSSSPKNWLPRFGLS